MSEAFTADSTHQVDKETTNRAILEIFKVESDATILVLLSLVAVAAGWVDTIAGEGSLLTIPAMPVVGTPLLQQLLQINCKETVEL